MILRVVLTVSMEDGWTEARQDEMIAAIKESLESGHTSKCSGVDLVLHAEVVDSDDLP